MTHDAHVQSIDEHKIKFEGERGTEMNFVDSWTYNVAAYKLSRLLELDMLDDVDKFEDFVPTLSIIDALRDPTEAQRRLARWMSEVVQRECGSP